MAPVMIDHHCPYCGRYANGAVGPEGNVGPRQGDFSICMYCGEFGVFDDAEPCGLRRTTEEETELTRTHPQFLALHAKWEELTALKRGRMH